MQDEIIRMAEETGFEIIDDKLVLVGYDGEFPVEMLERFADLAAAHEREACAKVCDEHGLYGAAPARDIRARSNHAG